VTALKPFYFLHVVIIYIMIQTFTIYTSEKCEHKKIVYRKAIVNLWLFKLEMTYDVCIKCGKIKPKRKYWRIN
jgi:hypothetical protein